MLTFVQFRYQSLTFASSGPELETDPDIKCGNFNLSHAAIEPGYDPPNAILIGIFLSQLQRIEQIV